MKAGKLRHRVTIQNFESYRDEYGQPVKEWHDVATVWADVSGISGRELLAAGREVAEVSHRVWIRYHPSVTAASRLLWTDTGAVLANTAALPDGKKTRLELLCK